MERHAAHTPDFTVLSTELMSRAAEIARLPRDDRSVSSVCAQISRYTSLIELPSVTPAPSRHGARPGLHGGEAAPFATTMRASPVTGQDSLF